ncbi:hypothetical protein [Altererythrobacter sp. Root672]|uniref:hypothetical protein n=1 Tax=Altererythrobacter sp. Root672 TaxID=1736584 RepID=UPI0006FA1BDA|nr:hypothetical protein [Altererythrobacter sp. Root672]KRA79715.1 hypothetical protein ASD76_16965 [Altererythrobacter sp. Root672]
MMRSIWLGSLICLTAACSPDSEDGNAQVLARDEVSAEAVPSAGNCSKVPADFSSSREFASSRPAPSGRELKNLIKIRADRSITWNGDDVSKSLLKANLRVVPQFYPVPLTTLDFDAGTPCPMINEVRELMRRHLECGTKAVCLQGGGWT